MGHLDQNQIPRHRNRTRLHKGAIRRLRDTDSLDSDMGVLGEEAFRWELDETRWVSLLCDEVPLGVDELGVGEFLDTECWDPDL